MRPITALPLLLWAACATADKASPPTADSGAATDSVAESPPVESELPDDSASDDSPADDSPADDSPTDDSPTDDSGEPFVPETALDCFGDIFDGGEVPDYDQYAPVMNAECAGTNHQDIVGVQRVVFVGDSITVGSPPTDPNDFYRVQLANALVSRFGLDAPDISWDWYDPFNGTTISQESGDFASCAKWGARTDDLMQDNDQVVDCLPEDQRDKTTLVVMTMGGNDLFNLAEGYNTGERSVEELWAQVYDYMQLMRDAVEWMTGDPTRFPNGIYVVFANLYEFTDSLGDVASCPGAEAAGYNWDLAGPELVEMINWSQEEFMHIAVDTQTDMIFLGENFCGHGYNRDDATGRCYRAPDADLWFDLTCFHPNDLGHTAIADMFESVIEE